jgi:DamX protein
VQRDRPQHGLVHVIEIPPLTESQTGELIAQRLGAVGHAVEDYFSPADLQRIAAAAAGNPARVVALARQHHANRPARRETGARRPAARAGRTGALPTRRLLPLGDRRLLPLFVLPPLLALATWWGLRDGDDSAPPGETVAVELPSAPTTASAAAPPAPASKPAPAPTPVQDTAPPPAAETPPDPRLADSGEPELIEIVLPDEPVLPPMDGMPAPAPSPTVPPAAAPVTPASDLAAAPDASSATAPAPRPNPAPVAPKPTQQPRPAVAQTPVPPTPAARPALLPATKPPPARPAPTRVTGFSADWLLKQPRGSYTLQLAGVRDRALAVHFIQQHGLGAAATILVTRRDGRPWYVLVHGYYPTRQAALAAAARLPAGVRKEVEPWARTIGELAKLPP